MPGRFRRNHSIDTNIVDPIRCDAYIDTVVAQTEHA